MAEILCNYEKYGGIFEIYLETRIISLNRLEYTEAYKKHESCNTEGSMNLGFEDKGLVFIEIMNRGNIIVVFYKSDVDTEIYSGSY